MKIYIQIGRVTFKNLPDEKVEAIEKLTKEKLKKDEKGRYYYSGYDEELYEFLYDISRDYDIELI